MKARAGRTAFGITVLTAALAANTSAAQDVAASSSSFSLERASRSRAKGLEGAPLFVYEFADLQCPHCARFALDVFPRIDSAFIKTGKVHWVFVNLPVPGHENAWNAHEAALCGGAIADRFWAMHDLIFAAQAEWSDLDDPTPVLTRIAREAGVPAQPFAACIAGDRVASLLLQDVIFAASSRVNGTPAFIVNNEQTVMGLKTFEEWKDLLEKQLLRGRSK